MVHRLFFVYFRLVARVGLLLSSIFGPRRAVDDAIPSVFSIGEQSEDRMSLLFLPTEHPDTKFHVVSILSWHGNTWFVDAGNKLTILPAEDSKIERLLAFFKPIFLVHFNLYGPSSVNRGIVLLNEPYSCVTMAKMLLGLDAPEVQYPEQLLNYLWKWKEDLEEFYG